jgi:hypothetical protein
VSYNPAVWYAFMARITPQDRARLDVIERGHELPVCPFVEAVCASRDPEPDRLVRTARAILRGTFDPVEYIGEPVRHTIQAKLGSCIIGSGEEPAGSFHQINNGGKRYWSSVVGEMEWR